MPPCYDRHAPHRVGLLHLDLVFGVNFPGCNDIGVLQFLEGEHQLVAVVGGPRASRTAKMFEGGHLDRVGGFMAGEKPVQPFGEIGLEAMPLLPLQLRPAGGKEIGELGVDAQR